MAFREPPITMGEPPIGLGERLIVIEEPPMDLGGPAIGFRKARNRTSISARDIT